MTPTTGEADFADHFSAVAADYARHRLDYPAALFDWIAEEAPATSRVWDCGTGSGQSAADLASRFREVVASDASVRQLAEARRSGGVKYLAAAAEASALAPASVDAVTVAQALHWFDGEGFAGELRRVLRPGGVVVAWTYPLFDSEVGVRAVVERFYSEIVGAYWPPERRWVERRYRDLSLPGEPLQAPALAVRRWWNLDELLGYVSTWSAVSRYRSGEGSDPMSLLAAELRGVWGEPAARREFRWQLAILAGRIPSDR